MKNHHNFVAIASLTLLLALTIPGAGHGQSDSQHVSSALTGQWWTPGFASRVALQPCADGICGNIVWLWDSRTAQPGQQILTGFQTSDGKTWTGGRAFNPEDGNTYRASIRLLPDNRLEISGCVLVFCQRQVWIKVQAVKMVPARIRRGVSQDSTNGLLR